MCTQVGPTRRRSRRSARALGIAAALVVAAAGCGSAGGSASSGDTQTVMTPTSRPLLAGMIAIGHSGLTGENSDPNSPAQPAFENSWATGSSAEVDSVYRRLVAAHPEAEGRVANAASGGAPVSSLAGQARTALHSVPTPELVIVQTIDDDIRCDGTDPSNVSSFGDALQQTLKAINAASPQSKILVVGQLGRPSPSFVAQLVADHPEVKHYLVGPGICDFYDQDGNLNKDSFTALTKIIDGYEAEQARVCAAVTNCRTDQGVRAAYTDKLENFTGDWNHLNVAGQAIEAKLIWPVVASFLDLS